MEKHIEEVKRFQQHINEVERFQREVMPQKKELFERLAKGQSPRTLFVTCSDSRVEPSLFLNASPGDIFVVRNAGNIIPPYQNESPEGNLATVEYAVGALKVANIIVCGHSSCGAMTGVMEPEAVKDLPLVAHWLLQAESTRRVVEVIYPEARGDERIAHAVRENVKLQLANLRTHPWVAARLERGDLRLYGWVYDIATGEVEQYDPKTRSWGELSTEPSII